MSRILYPEQDEGNFEFSDETSAHKAFPSNENTANGTDSSSINWKNPVTPLPAPVDSRIESHKRVGSEELENLLNKMDEEDKRHSFSLSIAPSWNYAMDGMPPRDSSAHTLQRTLQRNSTLMSTGRSSFASNTSKKLSYDVPPLQSNDFEQVHMNNRLSTRPPPPAIDSPNRVVSNTLERKQSWTPSRSSTAQAEMMSPTSTTPDRTTNHRMSSSPKFSSFFFNRETEEKTVAANTESGKENQPAEGIFSSIYNSLGRKG